MQNYLGSQSDKAAFNKWFVQTTVAIHKEAERQRELNKGYYNSIYYLPSQTVSDLVSFIAANPTVPHTFAYRQSGERLELVMNNKTPIWLYRN
jgi:hypothetical protein